MVIVCRRCFRRAQIEMPKVGARLRCTSCQTVQVFGERAGRKSSKNGRRPSTRQRREIAGVVRFDTRAPAAKVHTYEHFDDRIDDLFAAG
jgi:hypothetical protein